MTRQTLLPPFGTSSPAVHTPTEFHLSHELDKVKATRDFSKIVTEILTQIWDVEGNKCSLKIEVCATFPEGKVSQSVRRNIEENCRALSIDNAEFED